MDTPNRTPIIGQCWWDSISERTQLVRWLADEGRLDPSDLEAVLDVIEKPAKYTREYTDYCAAMTSERAALLLRRSAA
jgi:hypothetical protein